ncbi:hypothetical protein [Streptomyces sp. NPDC018972]|uniref:hypothetical protein n=1 Tax=Streptomyces sp. NPDC018972 TaxID=3365060 RepID=UPI003796C6BE
MEYVRVEALPDQYGFELDPQPYLDVLDQVAQRLPAGAAAWVREPGHYDFGSPRCVKDLTVGRASLTDEKGAVTLELRLAPNEWKHDEGLCLRYSDVREFRVGVDEDDGMLPRLGDLQLDEVLPHPAGLGHEIAFTNGSVRVVAADLTARWNRVSGD